MRKVYSLLLTLLFCAPSLWAQEVLFIPNEGQWEGEFSHKMPLRYGGLFFEKNSVQFVLKDAQAGEDHHGHDIHEAGLGSPSRGLKYHALRMTFLNSKPSKAAGKVPAEFVHNYFVGDDSTSWRSGVRPAHMLQYD